MYPGILTHLLSLFCFELIKKYLNLVFSLAMNKYVKS